MTIAIAILGLLLWCLCGCFAYAIRMAYDAGRYPKCADYAWDSPGNFPFILAGPVALAVVAADYSWHGVAWTRKQYYEVARKSLEARKR